MAKNGQTIRDLETGLGTWSGSPKETEEMVRTQIGMVRAQL